MLWVEVTLFTRSSSGTGDLASFLKGDGVRGITVEDTFSTLTASDPPEVLEFDCFKMKWTIKFVLKI